MFRRLNRQPPAEGLRELTCCVPSRAEGERRDVAEGMIEVNGVELCANRPPAASSPQNPSSHHSIDAPTPITRSTAGSLGSPNDAQVQRHKVVRELAGDLGGDVARETRRND